MKKVLSLVIAIAMVLSSFTVAFAAPEDVTNENQVKAVDALMSLGIVKGYTDGSYKPEQTVTRAEMAKMLVEALGNGDLAQGSESSFKDAKGKWYDGYVAMAAGLEMVTGYPDGTFKGDNPVSYQEAVVMTLRALGYTNSAVNNGVNSYNASKYKALGATLGLLKNVTFKNAGANRGDIAVMIYNALECETVKINEKGLAEKIVADKYTEEIANSDPKRTKEVIVYEVLLDRVADRDSVTVSVNSLNSKHKDYLGDKIDLTPYMYQNITAYFNADGEVIFVKRVNSPVVKGDVTPIRTTDIQWTDADNQTKVYVTKEDDSVEKLQFKKTANHEITVFLNGGETKAKLVDFQWDGSLDGAEVTFVLKDDIITYAIARQSTKTVQVTKAYKSGALTLDSITLPKNGSKVDLTKVTVTGAVDSIEDIAAKDVITVYNAAGETGVPVKTELEVCRDTVEGKITATNAGAYVIDGKSYFAGRSGLGLGVNSEGTFYLNSAGYIFAFEGKSMSNADYALIKSITDGLLVNVNQTAGTSDLVKDASIKIFNKEGKTLSYGISTSAKYKLTPSNSTKANTAEYIFAGDADARAKQQVENAFKNFKSNRYVVTGYETNSDNQIIEIAVKDLGLTPQGVNAGSRTFVAADDIVIYCSYNDSGDVFELAKVKDLFDFNKPNYYAVTNSKGEYVLIIANEKLYDNSSYAIVTAVDSALNDSGKAVSKVTGYLNGEKFEYLTSNSTITTPDLSDNDVRASLWKLPLSNGVIAKNMTPEGRPAVVTSSAIGVANVDKGTFKVNGSLESLAENGVVYVFEVSATRDRDTFVRVGDISDLDLDNAAFDLYDTNTSKEGYEVIIVRIQR